jgi:spectinomycin phosphotransferase
MLDRPAVSDERVVQALETRYGLAVAELEFLALGHDANAWAFRASTRDRAAFFVKVRRQVDPARLRFVRFLAAHGLDAVVAPISTREGSLSVAVGDFHLIVYPFVEARVAAEAGLTDAQWTEYGRIGAALHATHLDANLEASLPREAFLPAWGATIDDLHAAAAEYRGADEARTALAEFWRSHQSEIEHMRSRVGELGEGLRTRLRDEPQRVPFVPCHADFHTHNLFVEPGGGLRVFDWDEAMLAPRERDLMFVMGSPIGLAPGDRKLFLFEAGYGPIDIDPEVLAYYHADWAIQDIAGYAGQVMFDDISPESRAYSLRIFLDAFEPDGEAELALRQLSSLGAQ